MHCIGRRNNNGNVCSAATVATPVEGTAREGKGWADAAGVSGGAERQEGQVQRA